MQQSPCDIYWFVKLVEEPILEHSFVRVLIRDIVYLCFNMEYHRIISQRYKLNGVQQHPSLLIYEMLTN